MLSAIASLFGNPGFFVSARIEASAVEVVTRRISDSSAFWSSMLS